ncbi:hypothetical protein [Marinicauda sp. Alg238-R41]|uniref:hypothetical protein n=1 Tax=Marinicauda sp. Alg238-R41 TaxID=2993447 RepID=UPI0022DF811C|nr:hypothetical protein [Marinicauda sp. Alg238-R41]
MTDHADIIASLEKATGPGVLLDALVAKATGWVQKWKYDGVFCMDVPAGWVRFDGVPRACPPEYTASLDAAIALVERVLPGWSWGVSRSDEPGENGAPSEERYYADVFAPGAEYAADHATAPLALLCAAFDALQAQVAS